MVYRCLDSKESDLRGIGSPSGLIADEKPGRPPRTTGLFHGQSFAHLTAGNTEPWQRSTALRPMRSV